MNSPTFSLATIGVVSLCVAWAGCSSPQRSAAPEGSASTSQKASRPTVGTPMQDVRTEAKIQEIEMEYNAAKNSRPTRQHEAEAEATKKAKAKETEAAKAKEADEKKQP